MRRPEGHGLERFQFASRRDAELQGYEAGKWGDEFSEVGEDFSLGKFHFFFFTNGHWVEEITGGEGTNGRCRYFIFVSFIR